MKTNRNGTLNQRPLYGCTSCFEDYTWPASDLRVHDSECWCDTCWDERGWEFPDQPSWNDLEPYTPALQAERDALVEALDVALDGSRIDDLNRDNDDLWRTCYPTLNDHQRKIFEAHIKRLETALAAYRKQQEISDEY